ncbi:hypothetical protein AB0O76_28565 [Streptomyces sp. NPDC086554]|uniref:hypothetical protein n=1 Tax=Streptomyces sp. NPDC086554 TaxID=3154864 RepID=UPI003441FF66
MPTEAESWKAARASDRSRGGRGEGLGPDSGRGVRAGGYFLRVAVADHAAY